MNIRKFGKTGRVGRKALPFCFFALLPLQASAQEIFAVRDLIDCGNILYETPVTVKFELQNKGRRSLTIKNVHSACGCTTVEYPQNSIAAGEAFTISATYDARQLGHFSKDIAVYSNASNRPFYLTIRGVVAETMREYKGSFDYDLASVKADKVDVEFDNVNRGDRPVSKIRIHNTSGKEISPTVMHLPAYLKAAVSPTTIPAGRQGTVTLMLDSRKLRDYGLTQTSVYLGMFPGDKVASNKEISVSSILLPDFRDMTEEQLENAPHLQYSADVLNFTFGNKKKLSQTITLRNTGKSELEISSLQMFTVGLSVKLNKTHLQPGEETELKITANAKMLKQARSKPRVLMITNDPESPKVVVNINVQN